MCSKGLQRPEADKREAGQSFQLSTVMSRQLPLANLIVSLRNGPIALNERKHASHVAAIPHCRLVDALAAVRRRLVRYMERHDLPDEAFLPRRKRLTHAADQQSPGRVSISYTTFSAERQ